MAGIGPFNSGQLLMASAPTGDFRATADTTRYTSAVLIALNTVDTMAIDNSGGTSVDVPVAFQIVPLRTKAAVVAAGYTMIYCYPDNG